jgi:RNA polymerase sigma-70 factor (ECF subfamily)
MQEWLMKSEHKELTVAAEADRTMRPKLLRFFTRKLGDPHLAEDAVQDTLYAVHRSAAIFDNSQPIEPWVWSFAHRRLQSTAKRRRRNHMISLNVSHNGHGKADDEAPIEHADPKAASPLEETIMEEAREKIRGIMGKLPIHLRQVAKLHFLQGLSCGAIAKRGPVGDSAVHKRVAQVRAILQDQHGITIPETYQAKARRERDEALAGVKKRKYRRRAGRQKLQLPVKTVAARSAVAVQAVRSVPTPSTVRQLERLAQCSGELVSILKGLMG